MISDKYGQLPLHKAVSIARKGKVNINIIEELLEVFPKSVEWRDKKGYVYEHICVYGYIYMCICIYMYIFMCI
jgi:hypothetical protein